MSLARLTRVILAFITAITIGGLMLLALSFLASDIIVAGIFRLWEAILNSDNPDEIMRDTAFALGKLLTLLLAAPILLTGLTGEIAGWRSKLWYIVTTAILTAAVPWLLRTRMQQPTDGELQIAGYLAAVGAVIGLIYWLIANRRAPSLPKNGDLREQSNL